MAVIESLVLDGLPLNGRAGYSDAVSALLPSLYWRLGDQTTHTFTPKDIPGLECWLTADRITGLSDGTAVTTWSDASGNGKDATGTGTTRPLYKTGIQNGLPGVLFDGVDDTMSIAGLLNNDPTRTVFMIVRGISTGAIGPIIKIGGTQNAAPSYANTGQFVYSQNQVGSNVNLGASSAGGHLLTVRFNSASSMDGFLDNGAATNLDPDDSYQSGSSAWALGGSWSGFLANFYLMELIVYNWPLTSGLDYDQIRDYALNKYALPGGGSLQAPVTVASDASGNNRIGKIVGPTVTTGVPGLLAGDTDTAMTFSGSVPGIFSQYDPFVSGSSRTFVGWGALSSTAQTNLFGAGTNANMMMVLSGTTHDFRFGGPFGSGGDWVAAWPDSSNVRHMWAVTYNATTGIGELFIDGVSKGTRSGGANWVASGGRGFTLGMDVFSGANGAGWTHDDVAVVERILTAAEIQTLYAAGTNTPTNFILQGYEVPPPNKRVEWAQGADFDGSSLVRDPLCDNREVSLRLRVRQGGTMDAALSQIAALSKKLEEAEQQQDGLALVWTPANATKTMTMYVLSGVIDGLPITKSSGDDLGWLLPSPAPVFTVKLTCKPFGYGTPVTSSQVSSATPFVTMTLPSVPGDVPAEGRLLVTDAATQDRRYMEWGLEQRFFDPLTSLLVDSDDMVTSGYSGFQTTRTGAYDPNASGNNVIRGTASSAPTAICSTGNLGHVGTYRVKARLFCLPGTVTDFSKMGVRLSWQEGDGPLRSNPYTTPIAGSAFCEVDLGLVSIPPKQLGTQRWSGRIEHFTTSLPGTDVLEVDYLDLVPAGEGYGRARAAVTGDTPTAFSVRDEFNASGTLTGKVAPIGGAWTTSGVAPDFVEAGGIAARTATSDAGLFAISGVSAFATQAAQVDILASSWNAVTGAGVVARWVDASNYLLVTMTSAGQIVVNPVFPGTPGPTILNLYAFTPNIYYSLRVVVDATGCWWVWLALAGQIVGSPLATGQLTALATGGALATGKPGFYDRNAGALLAGRNYDNFMAWVPSIPAVLYSTRQAEIRADGAIRQDSTGVYYGPVPAYRGSRFLVPAAGDENRTSRLFVKAHRTDIEASPSANVTDNLTVQTIVTPRFMVVPF